ncbi:MAG: thermonuclease family protein [Hyphomonas sp.]|uniref:thermonuclease family protein n=1 Tax=Hyphomonas sp. TaxID=87 RepID=UPI003527A081
MWLRVLAVLVCFLAAACDRAGPLDGLDQGERGRVVRVLDGDALVLDTGQSVRLIGIEAPAGPYRDRQGEPFHEEAKRMLEDMALGREVQLVYAGLTRDRYDRALAHVRTIDALGPDLWLNAEMLKRGGARMRIYPDTALGSENFAGFEADARKAGLGVWALPAYRIALAENLPDDFARFQLVEGVVGAMRGTDDFGTVCNLALAGSQLVLAVRTGAAPHCQLAEGRRVLARGYVRDGKMEISHTLDLEPL